MENNVAFAWTVDGGWLYSTSRRRSRWRLPQHMEAKFQAGEIKDIKCAAFGTTAGSYFLSYITKELVTMFFTGPDVPSEFKDYLNDPKTGKVVRDATLKVVFGSNNSFFAWDTSSMRWSNIPQGLERWVQNELSPAGWKNGPPRLIALGADNAYLAVTTKGAWTYFVPDTWPELKKDQTIASFVNECKTDQILTAFFSASQVDHYVIMIKETIDYYYFAPEPVNNLCIVAESLMSETRQKEMRQAREQNAREGKARQDQEQRAKEVEEEKIRKALNQHYVSWKSRYEAAMLRHRTLTTFPHLPVAVCTCTNISCVISKAHYESLKACQHDVEKLLRASGNYSLEWLRKERIQWHPDKFARHCEPDFRVVLDRKATEMYAIFEVLIDLERKHT